MPGLQCVEYNGYKTMNRTQWIEYNINGIQCIEHNALNIMHRIQCIENYA
jgi:hypothetical protein